MAYIWAVPGLILRSRQSFSHAMITARILVVVSDKLTFRKPENTSNRLAQESANLDKGRKALESYSLDNRAPYLRSYSHKTCINIMHGSFLMHRMDAGDQELNKAASLLRLCKSHTRLTKQCAKRQVLLANTQVNVC